jgi:PIN domain nuclease of toxin-antitoxin system
MRLLLDTHAVIWAAEGDRRLGPNARQELQSCGEGEALVSDITLLEIAMLVAKKRIVISISLASYLQELAAMFPVLPIAPGIAAEAVGLALPHSDPFDRIIAATAKYHAIPLLTRDVHLAQYPGIATIW